MFQTNVIRVVLLVVVFLSASHLAQAQPYGATVGPTELALWNWGYSSGGFTINATANRGHSQVFFLQVPIVFAYFRTYIETVSGTCAGTCGLQVAIYSEDRTIQECVSEVGTSGNATDTKNINIAGAKILAVTSVYIKDLKKKPIYHSYVTV